MTRWCASRLRRRAAPGVGHDGLRGLEVFGGDQRLVGDDVGPDPAAGLVPAHPGLIAGGDVVDVQEDLVLALLVPDLPAGVAGVGHDDADGGLGPAFPGAVPVAGPVVLGRGGDLVAGEPFGDGEQAAPGEVLGEDPPDHPGGAGVGFQLVQALAVGGLGRVGVRPGVGEPVAVGRPAAEEPALQRGLGGHGGADPQLDPVPLAFGQAAEHRHDQVVGLGVRVDRPADLRDPQLDAVVGEHGHHQAVLVAVERPLRLPDHHRVKAPVRVGQVGEQLRGAGTALPRQRPGLADVEVVGHDDPAGRLDQGAAAGLLPVVGRLGILVVLGRDPAEEPESPGQGGWVRVGDRQDDTHPRFTAARLPGGVPCCRRPAGGRMASGEPLSPARCRQCRT